MDRKKARCRSYQKVPKSLVAGFSESFRFLVRLFVSVTEGVRFPTIIAIINPSAMPAMSIVIGLLSATTVMREVTFSKAKPTKLVNEEIIPNISGIHLIKKRKRCRVLRLFKLLQEIIGYIAIYYAKYVRI